MVDDSGIDPNHDPHQYDVDEAELTGGNKSVDTAEEDGEESEEDNEELQPDELEKRDWLTAWRRPTTMAPGRRKDYIIFSDNATTPYCPPPNTILPSETSEVKRRREFRNLLNQLSYLSDGEHSHLGRIAMQATTSEYREDREARFYQLAGIQLDCSKPSNSLPADKQGDSLYQHAYAIQLHYEERCQVHYQEFLELLTDARNNIDNYMLSQQMEPWMQQMKYLFDSIMMLTPDIPGHNVLFEPIWENVTNPSLHQDTLWEDRLEPMAERNREAFNSLINSHNWDFSADADPTSAYTRTDYLSALIHESAVLDTLTSDDKDDIDHSAYEEWMEKVNRTVNQAPPSESVKDLLRKDLFKDEISATPAKVPPFTVNYDVNAWVQPKNMTNARNPAASAKVLRWKMAIQEYDFHITHIPGKDNIVADALSRIPVPDDETEDMAVLSAVLRAAVIPDEAMTHITKAHNTLAAQRIHNAKLHETTGLSPSDILFGSAISLDHNIFVPEETRAVRDVNKELSTYMQNLLSDQQRLLEIARKQIAVRDAANLQARKNDSVTIYPVGSWVLYSDRVNPAEVARKDSEEAWISKILDHRFIPKEGSKEKQ
eukprot:gene27323-34023_t